MAMKHRDPAKSPTSTHSLRCEDALWAKVRERAESEGFNINHVLNELLDGYAEGYLHMPTTRVIKDYTGTVLTGGD